LAAEFLIKRMLLPRQRVILTPSSAAEVRARIMRDTREEVEAEIRY
jgi:hypothetical protein